MLVACLDVLDSFSSVVEVMHNSFMRDRCQKRIECRCLLMWMSSKFRISQHLGRGYRAVPADECPQPETLSYICIALIVFQGTPETSAQSKC